MSLTLLTRLKKLFRSRQAPVNAVDNTLLVDETKAWVVNRPIILKLIGLDSVVSREQQKEIDMAKKKVMFSTTDGMQPRKSDSPGKPFNVRLPMTVNISAHSSKEIRLGVSCELPVVLSRDGVASLFAPRQEISVTLKNSGDSVLSFGEGEVVAQAYVVDCTEMELAK